VTDTLQLFFALLSIVAAAGAVICAVALACSKQVAVAEAFIVAVRPAARWLAAAVAVTATAGSLYFSEVAGYVPCTLCWYQRIAMYPLASVCVAAALRRDRGARWYVYPLAAAGAAVSVYHRYIELNPDAGGACSLDVPCSAVWFEEFGVFTLSVMALCGFAAIAALCAVAASRAGSDHAGSGGERGDGETAAQAVGER
jgi:disulfide bond formation protein DsbB